MQKLLAKYIYKNYYELLKDDNFNLELARLGWSKPAVIPRQTILYENRLIREHLTHSLKSLMTDFEFERILCQVGYTGPACSGTTTSTTSTTTTTVTTAGPGNNNLLDFNNVGAVAYGDTFAADFDASLEQALYISSNPSLQGGETDLFFVGWMRFDAVGALPMVLLSKDDNLTKAGSEYYFGFFPDYGSFVFQIEECCHTLPNDGTTWFVISTTGLPTAGRWYFVTGWYNHIAGTVNIRIDNGIIDTLSGAPNETNVTDTAFSIGSVVGSVTDQPECCSFMNGQIKSVGFFKRVLTNQEVATLYNRTFVNTGTRPGTLQTGTAYIADVPSALSGNVNSISFNAASTSRISLPFVGSLSATSSAVSVWFKADTLTGVILGNSINANTYIRLLNSTTIRVQTDVTGTFKDYTVPTINTGTWYHLLFIRTANTSRIYLNGVESSTGGQTQGDEMTFDQIGRYWDGSVGSLNFDGNLSELIVYHETLGPSLDSADIALLASGQPASPNPYYYTKMNEGSGTSANEYIFTAEALEYADLPSAFQNESTSTFISWWDLKELSGTRFDNR